jgi:hypothetical protein
MPARTARGGAAALGRACCRWMNDLTGTTGASFLLLASSLAAAAVLMWFVRPESRPPAPEPSGRFVPRTPESEPAATR